MAPWFEWARAWRDRLLTSPLFQRWALATPFVRVVARRRARALFDICAGFVYTQILLAAVRLDLFAVLQARPMTIAELSDRLALPEEAATRLVRATTALELTERRGERFGLGPLGAALLGNPGVAAMVEHHALLYADLSDPLAMLRGEAGDRKLSAYWGYAETDRPTHLKPDDVAEYSRLMAASHPFIAAEAIAVYPFARHRRVLDVGGGEGAFALALAEHAPQLAIGVFDLPAVAERARTRIGQSPHDGRVAVYGGDFLHDRLPTGYDLITLVRVIHDHDDAAALTMLRAAREALEPGGTLLIVEPMAGAAGAEPMGDAYFGFYLMAMGSGRPRTPPALIALLREAGFTRPRLHKARMPLLARAISASA